MEETSEPAQTLTPREDLPYHETTPTSDESQRQREYTSSTRQKRLFSLSRHDSCIPADNQAVAIAIEAGATGQAVTAATSVALLGSVENLEMYHTSDHVAYVLASNNADDVYHSTPADAESTIENNNAVAAVHNMSDSSPDQKYLRPAQPASEESKSQVLENPMSPTGGTGIAGQRGHKTRSSRLHAKFAKSSSTRVVAADNMGRSTQCNPEHGPNVDRLSDLSRDGDMNDIEYIDLWKLNQLQDECRKRGLKVGGKKQTLRDRILKHHSVERNNADEQVSVAQNASNFNCTSENEKNIEEMGQNIPMQSPETKPYGQIGNVLTQKVGDTSTFGIVSAASCGSHRKRSSLQNVEYAYDKISGCAISNDGWRSSLEPLITDFDAVKHSRMDSNRDNDFQSLSPGLGDNVAQSALDGKSAKAVISKPDLCFDAATSGIRPTDNKLSDYHRLSSHKKKLSEVAPTYAHISCHSSARKTENNISREFSPGRAQHASLKGDLNQHGRDHVGKMIRDNNGMVDVSSLHHRSTDTAQSMDEGQNKVYQSSKLTLPAAQTEKLAYSNDVVKATIHDQDTIVSDECTEHVCVENTVAFCKQVSDDASMCANQGDGNSNPECSPTRSMLQNSPDIVATKATRPITAGQSLPGIQQRLSGKTSVPMESKVSLEGLVHTERSTDQNSQALYHARNEDHGDLNAKEEIGGDNNQIIRESSNCPEESSVDPSSDKVLEGNRLGQRESMIASKDKSVHESAAAMKALLHEHGNQSEIFLKSKLANSPSPCGSDADAKVASTAVTVVPAFPMHRSKCADLNLATGDDSRFGHPEWDPHLDMPHVACATQKKTFASASNIQATIDLDRTRRSLTDVEIVSHCGKAGPDSFIVARTSADVANGDSSFGRAETLNSPASITYSMSERIDTGHLKLRLDHRPDRNRRLSGDAVEASAEIFGQSLPPTLQRSISGVQSENSHPPMRLPGPPPPSPVPASALRPPVGPSGYSPTGNALVKDIFPLRKTGQEDQARVIPDEQLEDTAAAAAVALAKYAEPSPQSRSTSYRGHGVIEKETAQDTQHKNVPTTWTHNENLNTENVLALSEIPTPENTIASILCGSRMKLSQDYVSPRRALPRSDLIERLQRLEATSYERSEFVSSLFENRRCSPRWIWEDLATSRGGNVSAQVRTVRANSDWDVNGLSERTMKRLNNLVEELASWRKEEYQGISLRSEDQKSRNAVTKTITEPGTVVRGLDCGEAENVGESGQKRRRL